MNAAVISLFGVALIALVAWFKWNWVLEKLARFDIWQKVESSPPLPYMPVQLVHRLYPPKDVVENYQVEAKDSLDEHLDVLTKKLAEKVLVFDQEGRLRLSKSKIRETQHELDNLQELHATDNDVHAKYRQIMETMRSELVGNENECRKLQQQIEWVSRRRAELNEEVHHGQRLYGEAAADLASNLTGLQLHNVIDSKLTDKQRDYSLTSLRHRKEPLLPNTSRTGSIGIKSLSSLPTDQENPMVIS